MDPSRSTPDARAPEHTDRDGDQRVVYLDNAATSWPKPETVSEAAQAWMSGTGSPERAASISRPAAENLLSSARLEIATFLGVDDPSHLFLLPGCTRALSLAIHGIDWRPGNRILMSGFEHHAVSGPVRRVAKDHGVGHHVAPPARKTPVDIDFVEQTLKTGKVRLVVCTMASNVTGDILPVDQIIPLARRYGALSLIDAAQTAGVVPLSARDMQPDMLAVAGHKGLLGPAGVGALWVSRHPSLTSLSRSCTASDASAHDLGSITGTAEGVAWLTRTGPDRIRERLQHLTRTLVHGLKRAPGVTVFGPDDPDQRTSTVSIRIDGQDPQTVSARLARSGIITRAGYHCAPLAHQTLGTLHIGGTVRLSPGVFNTQDDIQRAIEHISKIASMTYEPASV